MSEQQLDAAEQLPIHLTELKDLTEYRVEILAAYDPIDGGDKITLLLASERFTTSSALTLSATVLSPTEASYTLTLHVPQEDTVGYRLLLYKGAKKFKEIDPSSETISDLLSDSTYTLHVDYFVGKHLLRRSVEFQTPKMPVPTVSIGNIKSGKGWGSFRVSVTDKYESITDLRVDLWQSGKIVHTHNSTGTIKFTDLASPFEHVIRVTYTYDLHDGKDPITKTTSALFHTQSEGLKIENGKVTGIGSCTDTELYINMPIGSNAFKNTAIEKLYLGKGCTTIGRYAFENCKKLTSVSIENGLNKIDYGAFSLCESLQSIHLPASFSTLGSSVFTCCTNLKSVIFEEGLIEIGTNVFWRCDNLTEVVLPSTLTTIGSYAFAFCTIDSIYIPKSVTTIGNQALSGIKTIYAEASEKPVGWADIFMYASATIHWGATREQVQ